MAHIWATHRAPNYERFAEREKPNWFKDAKLGIFVHWGPYSVPAWAEPTGELGKIDTVEPEQVHKHNPYAEWYFNTMRFPDGPTAEHHRKVYNDAPYDDFLDTWKAKDFDADKLVRMFKRAGARYVVPVSKHHDGVTLWDAPGTGERNTVHRGPKRDLIDEWAQACKKEDVKFGVYYSTGIDWHVWPTAEPYHVNNQIRAGINDHEYNEYAWRHCHDLIEKYKPFMLWGDIDWPKAGVAPGKYSVEALLDELYTANPEAVVNDRFGDTHWDFQTVEYGLGEPPKDTQMWQFTRGIGLSFGYNQVEDESHSLSGLDVLRLLIDVCSSGGDLLLNVGPDADGNIPPVQMRCLEALGDWMDVNGEAIYGTSKVDAEIATPHGKTEGEWVRWTRKGDRLFAFVDGTEGEVTLPVKLDRVDMTAAKLLNGDQVDVQSGGVVDVSKLPTQLRPACIEFRIR
ncbi:uncharacterized protein EHS24_005381 [Apiotrichum porosum]|uniref:alpha-L-fucosidase n=1 Tax=Apiotrichum porosum TaxID=105984 RepID=A0A427XCS3_9TREE|nr:uncharacterized protein EHS24_005381 [Apiotrichum porosum]RSH76635.1 hypothetical protein EHS24_005381 [Apiotrichum porosum]